MTEISVILQDSLWCELELVLQLQEADSSVVQQLHENTLFVRCALWSGTFCHQFIGPHAPENIAHAEEKEEFIIFKL